MRGAMLEANPPCTLSSGNLEHWKRASIRLSQNKLSALGNGSTLQVSCTSILVKSGHYYYKQPLLASEERNLFIFSLNSPKSESNKHSILINGVMYFQYDIVPHSPLTHSAVKECFFDLVQKIHTARFKNSVGWDLHIMMLGFQTYVLMTTIMLF